MKKKKFNISFKLDSRETGLAAVGNCHRGSTIKVNKVDVGCISPPNWQSKKNIWKVRMKVKSRATENCGWGWAQFKADFPDDASAREFVKRVLPDHADDLYFSKD